MALQKLIYQSSQKSIRIRTFFHRLAFRKEAVDEFCVQAEVSPIELANSQFMILG